MLSARRGNSGSFGVSCAHEGDGSGNGLQIMAHVMKLFAATLIKVRRQFAVVTPFDRDHAVAHAHAGVSRHRFVGGRWESEFGEALRERAIGDDFAVDDDAVEVENDGAGHGRIPAISSLFRRTKFAFGL
jgi:hypothetical protein